MLLHSGWILFLMIDTIFVDNLVKARRRLRTLAGLVRLRRVLDGNAVKSQTVNTLQCMQTLARVQTQIRSRRIRMTQENQALQMHLQRKRERELNKVKVSMHFISLSATPFCTVLNTRD